ncbi:helix-turn-helix domain-containing protein [Convivina praedatoris]|nr:helix-turn-helix domain-containing protein [Convivina sp. LMG 32447]
MKVKLNMYSLTKKRWQAINEHDASYNNQFLYGVTTDHRVCCPGCLRPKQFTRKDIEIFKTPDESLIHGFIPCPDCHPFGKLDERASFVLNVKSYLVKNYAKRITLEELSQTFHTSTGVLHRSFLLETDETPQNYLLHVRMFHATEFLKNTNLSIAAIGLKVGIPNLSYFNTVFKQQAGLTAVQYRKQFN